MTPATLPPDPTAEPVPEAFRVRLEAWLADADAADREAAVEAGLRALRCALEDGGRERGGAFDLLAADALLTRACEAAVAEDDPVAALEDVLARVVRVAG